MTDHEALAIRIEAMSEPNEDIFEDSFRLFHPKPARIWITDNTGDWAPEYAAWVSVQNGFFELVEIGAYLDAAMMLCGDIAFSVGKNVHHGYWTASLNVLDEYGVPRSIGSSNAHKSAAIALLSAVVRASAS